MGHPDDRGPQYFALKIESLHFGVDSEGSDDVLDSFMRMRLQALGRSRVPAETSRILEGGICRTHLVNPLDGEDGAS